MHAKGHVVASNTKLAIDAKCPPEACFDGLAYNSSGSQSGRGPAKSSIVTGLPLPLEG